MIWFWKYEKVDGGIFWQQYRKNLNSRFLNMHSNLMKIFWKMNCREGINFKIFHEKRGLTVGNIFWRKWDKSYNFDGFYLNKNLKITSKFVQKNYKILQKIVTNKPCRNKKRPQLKVRNFQFYNSFLTVPIFSGGLY